MKAECMGGNTFQDFLTEIVRQWATGIGEILLDSFFSLQRKDQETLGPARARMLEQPFQGCFGCHLASVTQANSRQKEPFSPSRSLFYHGGTPQHRTYLTTVYTECNEGGRESGLPHGDENSITKWKHPKDNVGDVRFEAEKQCGPKHRKDWKWNPHSY